jgi:hypothetical protein
MMSRGLEFQRVKDQHLPSSRWTKGAWCVYVEVYVVYWWNRWTVQWTSLLQMWRDWWLQIMEIFWSISCLANCVVFWHCYQSPCLCYQFKILKHMRFLFVTSSARSILHNSHQIPRGALQTVLSRQVSQRSSSGTLARLQAWRARHIPPLCESSLNPSACLLFTKPCCEISNPCNCKLEL